MTAKKKSVVLEVVCKKCDTVVTGRMLMGKATKCPVCDEPDQRYFDFDNPDWSKTYPPGEEEDST